MIAVRMATLPLFLVAVATWVLVAGLVPQVHGEKRLLVRSTVLAGALAGLVLVLQGMALNAPSMAAMHRWYGWLFAVLPFFAVAAGELVCSLADRRCVESRWLWAGAVMLGTVAVMVQTGVGRARGEELGWDGTWVWDAQAAWSGVAALVTGLRLGARVRQSPWAYGSALAVWAALIVAAVHDLSPWAWRLARYPLLWIAVLLLMARLVAEVLTHMRAVQYRLMTDHLTGAYTRRYLEQALDREQGGIGLLFLDIDNFKDINDRYGHTVGDLVLKEMVRQVSGMLSPGDFVARYGGDEFVAVVHADSLAALEQLADRIRAELAGCTWPRREGGSVPVQVSVGVAYTEAGENWRQVLVRADAHMYAIKGVRRQQASRAEGEGSS